MNLNRVTIVGRLEKDPEVLVTQPRGTSLAKFQVRTDTAYQRSTGGSGFITEYHFVVSFDAHAAFLARKLRRGDLVLFEGRLQTRSWLSDGVKHFRTEVVAERIDRLPDAERGTDNVISET